MKIENLQLYLHHLGIKQLNAMQEEMLSAVTKADNILLLSNTGTGKTLAFLLPILLQIDRQCNKTQYLIVAPSRELALQIESVFKKLKTGIKITCCYGGHKREIEENNLSDTPAIIVGTPGRICDHIRRGNIDVANIHNIILDEFDKSLELGFVEELAFIFASLPIQKRWLISATTAVEMPDFVQFNAALTLNYLQEEVPEEKLQLQYLKTNDKDKLYALFELLCHIGNRLTIVFCNHREAVERVSHYLAEQGIVNVFYHGAMEQRDRDTALCKFRNGTVNFLVTTDIASRGLDIANIRYIIHYHLPVTEDIFKHRNGRTARMEASGTALLLLAPDENLPEYVNDEVTELTLSATLSLPEKTEWVTFYMPLGKKDKVNKVDIVGFLIQKGEVKKEDIGLIEVKDYHAFFAIKRKVSSRLFNRVKEERIKNKKAKIAIAK